MKTFISIADIKQEVLKINFPSLDIVVGIATGGSVLATLLAYHLDLPLELIRINYRNEVNQPRYDYPLIISNLVTTSLKKKNILLVDDVAVSGKTLQVAKQNIVAKQIYTLVIKGKADYVLFPHVATCIDLPWHV